MVKIFHNQLKILDYQYALLSIKNASAEDFSQYLCFESTIKIIKQIRVEITKGMIPKFYNSYAELNYF